MKRFSIFCRTVLITWVGVTCSCSTVNTTASITSEKPPPLSQPAEKDGLAVTIRPTKTIFRPDEPLAFEVTYRNVSKEPFRLPDQPERYGAWLLKCSDMNSGKTYTGGFMRIIEGVAGSVEPGQAIPPGGTLVTTTTFHLFGFIEGDVDINAFAKAVMKLIDAAREKSPLNTVIVIPPLPTGTYQISVHIQYLLKVEPDVDPVPVWKDRDILSNPAEITIAP